MKTAVQWLEERLIISMPEELKPLRGLFVIAKEMEKKQITDAYDISGIRSVINDKQQGDGQDYYNYLINDYSE